MKILTVVGARPQFVKAAMVSHALVNISGLVEVVVHTGQHYDDALSDRIFTDLSMPPPNYNLGVGSGTHGAQTGRMLEKLDDVIKAEKPDWVLLYGDTNSTLAGALAAAKLQVPIAHVEAGLRSFNRAMPEEINRLITDQVSSLLFAPTQVAVDNLAKEGIAGDKVRLVGDVMYDAALTFGQRADADSLLSRLGVKAGDYVLSSIHRAENTDDPARLSAILAGLLQTAHTCPVVLPCHPRTRAALGRAGLLEAARDGLIMTEPFGYLDMLAAERLARAIVTDSGGVQKEAYFFGIPCLVVRRETEWVELVEMGCARLTEPQAIASSIGAELLFKSTRDQTLYGGGRAALRVAETLSRFAPLQRKTRLRSPPYSPCP